MTSGEVLSLIPLILAALAPASLVVSAFLISRQGAKFPASAVFVTTMAAMLAYLAVALHPILSLVGFDPKVKASSSGMNDVVQLGLVTSCMFVLVSTLAVIVVRYARTYLAGQKELDRFARSLLLTVASATVLVISNHFAVLVLAWFATDVGLHQLLTFFPTRRQAVIVAHKKFLLSRVADACFVSSIVLIGGQTGSLQIDYVNDLVMQSGSLSPTLHVATVLLVLGVLLKSAQIPFHGWMLSVMEAPTPVSALLHAGVVNIGGYVMIRVAPLMGHAYIAQTILVAVGLGTTIIAALVMMTRVAIKGVLAWSTIGQMGFMLVQCGLGAWHLALMHLLAHSLYKAHTFLSSGSVVQQWRASHLVHSPHMRIWHVLIGLIILSVFVAPYYADQFIPSVLFDRDAAALTDVVRHGHRIAAVRSHLPESLPPLTLMLGLSFVPMLGRAIAAGFRPFLIALGFTLGASVAYFGWHVGFELLAPQVNAGFEASPFMWNVVVIGLVVLFLGQTILQSSPNGWFANRVQPHLVSGLYIDDWVTRVTFRLWPPGFK